jgi:GNAT superfamily N-acetyltransferase
MFLAFEVHGHNAALATARARIPHPPRASYTRGVKAKASRQGDPSMIRPTAPEETPELLELAQGTDVFKPHEIVALQEVLDDYHAFAHEHGHRSVSYVHDGRTIGFVYYAPAAMTDRTWYLYWIAVKKLGQARGTGSALLHWTEHDILRQEGRLLLIETSSLPHYEPTRRFYLKHGYERSCVIADYYADGDDLIVFRKRLHPRAEPTA